MHLSEQNKSRFRARLARLDTAALVEVLHQEEARPFALEHILSDRYGLILGEVAARCPEALEDRPHDEFAQQSRVV